MGGMTGKGGAGRGWEEVLSCSGAAARCSTFFDRNGGQVQLYMKATWGKSHRRRKMQRRKAA